LLARRDVPEASLEEGAPDHLGANLEMAEASEAPIGPLSAKTEPIHQQVVPAALITKVAEQPGKMSAADSASSAPSMPALSSENLAPPKLPAGGTVVLDVEEGGIEMPSFLGKTLRSAMEAAQDAGFDLDAIGSGVAREQLPAPGAHVAAGSRVVVRFGR
jgi:cell division protein FtsI (penicillin-binding protein 3)